MMMGDGNAKVVHVSVFVGDFGCLSYYSAQGHKQPCDISN